MTDKPIPLTMLIRELEAAGYRAGELRYDHVWNDAVRGRIPMFRSNGRWYSQREDLTEIARIYGLRRESRPTRRVVQ